MDLTHTIINGVVVAIVGGLLGFLMIDRFRQVDARFDSLERRMDRFDGRLEKFEDRIDALRSDLTGVALAVGARPKSNSG